MQLINKILWTGEGVNNVFNWGAQSGRGHPRKKISPLRKFYNFEHVLGKIRSVGQDKNSQINFRLLVHLIRK